MTRKRYMTVKEASRFYGVSVMTLWRWRQNKQGPAFDVVNGRVRYIANENQARDIRTN